MNGTIVVHQAMRDPRESMRVQWLLSDLCAKMGFCLAQRQQERFEMLVAAGADAFADAVLIAEGLQPEENKLLRREVRAFVAARFGSWPSA